MSINTRPDPDKLLALIRTDEGEPASGKRRGRLKIFFGASAGVGKTFAMLTEAQRLHTEGRNVTIGVAEHHGRAETLALIDGLPVLPLREIDHRGIRVHEFDLDAALTQHPDLILVDEYAHTNAPGSRHPKRWQDIEELLDHGIDVYTTLNVQHLESLNDMVARLTGVWVKETVPDAAFDAADEIALIDLPPDELLKRLHDGKVYVAEGANHRAAENFFKKSNLGRLRELALRRTTERVDAQNDALSAAQGHDEAATGDKILALVGPDALSSRLIRHTKRMADRTRAPWSALYLHTDRHETLSPKARLRVEHNLRLVEKLGGRVVRLNAARAATAILGYARHNGFTRLVLGHSHQPWWRRLLGATSLSQKLIERGAGLEITTLNADLETAETPRDDTSGWEVWAARPRDYLMAAAIIAACTLLGLPFRNLTDPDTLIMLYLIGVVITAARFSIGPAVLASVLSVAAFNWFFITPYYTFTFDDVSYAVTFVVMLITSLIVGSLTAQLSRHARLARKGEAETRLLYDLSRQLSAVRGVEAMGEVLVRHLQPAFEADIRLWAGERQITGAPLSDAKEIGARHWVMQNHHIAGRHTDTLPSASGLYLPVMAENSPLGVLSITPRADDRQFTGADQLVFETVASLIAGAFQRARQAELAETSRVESENERLRNVLLASLSHDLKTPLTVMNGSVSSLLKLRKKLPREAVEELTNLWGHLTRLQKFVTNLLRMAAITSGQMRLNLEPYLIQEITGAAIARVEPQKGARQIRTTVSGQLPMVQIDGALIEQVLINLIENAIAHTDDNGIITITLETDADRVRVRISDDGEGLRPGEETRIFNKFHSGKPAADRDGSGTGLGLAICKGIVEAHGGMIYAKNNPPKDDAPTGASFIFTLPIAK
ncbi:sensor histidine kinase KdpD [Asticcacaulis sp. SL142]|uniref:sensor histidine kinase n=1 Tax=Asticcacaulis sp. SL142 TaxID=2995155 RepID=UPI00226D006D|nr:sensor histidine kinase KdpD [Asticcacaulis sp. SL142]WAC49170.1 sensor histidine kinase KdpD [Asticcacaulis sp. SL142]